MRNLTLLFLLLAPSFLISQPYILEIGDDQKITLDEFRHIYFKNNIKGDTSITQKDIDEYLDLFINFKLKVYEAEKTGMAKNQEFVKELKKYRDQLAEPYLIDNNTLENLYREAYDRKFKAVRASHILLKLSEDAAPSDTLAQYKKSVDLIKRINKGESFEDLAVKYSDDPSAKTNKGDVGFFSSMRMVYPFENAAYNTPVGKLTTARTRFGYHIIRVTDTLAIQGMVGVNYIMVYDKNGDKEAAAAKIQEAYDSLQAGMTIHQAISTYSEDPKKHETSGYIGNYEPGGAFGLFDSTLYRLEDGHYSKPFYFEPGKSWFIVYLEGKRAFLPYEKLYEVIKNNLKRMPQNYLGSKTLAEKLLKEYKYTKNIENIAIAIDTIENSHQNKIKFSDSTAKYLTQAVLTFNNAFDITQYEYAQFMLSKIGNKTIEDVKSFCDSYWTEFLERSVINFENSLLEKKHPEFAATVQEYHDGILLFNITDSLVWQYASKDSTGLNDFFEKNISQYQWDERTETVIITSNKPELKNKIEKELNKLLKKGDTAAIAEPYFRKKLKDTTITITSKHVLFEKGQDENIDKLAAEKGLHNTQTTQKEITWTYVVGKVQPMSKQLNEIRGMVTADYQNYLEKQWIEQLRKKYPYKVNKEVLNQLIQK